VKVTGVRTIPFSYELSRRIGDANLAVGAGWNTQVAVLVDTDEGVTGSGLAAPGCEPNVAALADLIVGEDPAGVRGLWERMAAVLFKRGAAGGAGQAMAALDVALWDLKAKDRGEPLWRTLGGTERVVRAYASGLDMPLDDDELRDYYCAMGALGFTAGKLKVGLDPEDDQRRMAIMRDALYTTTGRATLLMDANELWSAKQAIRRVRELEREFDIAWVEEPVDRFDARSLRKVSEAVSAAVATGENLTDVHSFVALIDQQAVDVVQPNIGCGGITGVLQVAELAYAHNLPLAMVNCHGHVLAHVAALFPNHVMMEVIDPCDAAVVRSAQDVVDGAIHLTDQPGHGMWFDDADLEAHRDAAPPDADLAVVYRRHPDARRLEAGRQPGTPGR
jgi:L-alanine-DL-glutamate epimerase-like enolase superfamily enzyme